MNEELLLSMKNKGITRFCHFTKSKNIAQILNNFNGILATEEIPEYYRDINDLNRFDGKNNYICCSVEYPNVYYLNTLKGHDRLFNEWAILSIDLEVIKECDVLFSKVNAATEKGKYIKEGIEGFNSMYEKAVNTSKRQLKRSLNLPSKCPTDIQAEAMILQKIDKKYIKEIIVPTIEQARAEYARMKVLGINENIDLKVCSELFQTSLADKLNSGKIPEEIFFKKI